MRTLDLHCCNIGDIGVNFFAYTLARDKRLVQLVLGEAGATAADVVNESIQAMMLPQTLAMVPWPLVNKTAFMLCMKHCDVMRGKYVPTDVFNLIFSFLRLPVKRIVSGLFYE